MAEYIDLDTPLELYVERGGFCTKQIASLRELLDTNKIPYTAADARPVVRCGECKHWFENGTDYCSCDRDALLRERDFFCAAGEKREES